MLFFLVMLSGSLLPAYIIESYVILIGHMCNNCISS